MLCGNRLHACCVRRLRARSIRAQACFDGASFYCRKRNAPSMTSDSKYENALLSANGSMIQSDRLSAGNRLQTNDSNTWFVPLHRSCATNEMRIASCYLNAHVHTLHTSVTTLRTSAIAAYEKRRCHCATSCASEPHQKRRCSSVVPRNKLLEAYCVFELRLCLS